MPKTNPMLAGERTARLVLVSLAGTDKHRHRLGVFDCDCGARKEILIASVRSGRTVSCGCATVERAAQMNRTHGHTVSSRARDITYTSWCAMKARCQNPKHPKYPDYGGRGITVCERWQAFEAFLADMGPRPIGTTIDRRDNAGNYEPGNCRWATATEQTSNRRANVKLQVGGEQLTVTEIARRSGVKADLIYSRIRRGDADPLRGLTGGQQ